MKEAAQGGGADLLVCQPWMGDHQQKSLLEAVADSQEEDDRQLAGQGGTPVFLCVLLP